MRKTSKSPGKKIVKDFKRAVRKQYSAEEKIRIVQDGLRGEYNIAELCRGESISQVIYYRWLKDFMEAGKRRQAGDTARAATTDEVKDLRREARDLKEIEAEQALELRLLKKHDRRPSGHCSAIPCRPMDRGAQECGMPHLRSWRSSGWLRARRYQRVKHWPNRVSCVRSIVSMILSCSVARRGCKTKSFKPKHVWNRIPDEVRRKFVKLAQKETELSPRELTVTFTHRESYFVSEASAYRILKAHDLITSPAFIVLKAAQ